jgi:hypothetical protein
MCSCGASRKGILRATWEFGVEVGHKRDSLDKDCGYSGVDHVGFVETAEVYGVVLVEEFFV